MIFLFQRWDIDSFPGWYGLLLPFSRKQKWWYLKTCCLPICVCWIWFPSQSMLAYLLVGQVVPSTIHETQWITVNTCSNLRTNTMIIRHVICTHMCIYIYYINMFLFVHTFNAYDTHVFQYFFVNLPTTCLFSNGNQIQVCLEICQRDWVTCFDEMVWHEMIMRSSKKMRVVGGMVEKNCEMNGEVALNSPKSFKHWCCHKMPQVILEGMIRNQDRKGRIIGQTMQDIVLCTFHLDDWRITQFGKYCSLAWKH